MRRRSTNSIAVPPPPERYSSLFRDPEMIASDTTGHTAMLVALAREAANPLNGRLWRICLGHAQVDFECAGQRPRATVDGLRASLIARQVAAKVDAAMAGHAEPGIIRKRAGLAAASQGPSPVRRAARPCGFGARSGPPVAW
jgi:hypothetical protein